MPKRILVVDDDKRIVQLIQKFLERAGYQVVTVYDHDGALQMAQAEKPDLISVGDVQPNLDGFGLLKSLKDNSKTREIPVIMISRRALDHEVSRAWQGGTDCYLTKPFNPLELLTFVKIIFKALG